MNTTNQSQQPLINTALQRGDGAALPSNRFSGFPSRRSRQMRFLTAESGYSGPSPSLRDLPPEPQPEPVDSAKPRKIKETNPSRTHREPDANPSQPNHQPVQSVEPNGNAE